MATKTLTITEDAYERLRTHKREGESFTDTILRITDPDGEPMAGFGVMGDIEGFREAVEGTRDRLDDDLHERHDRGNAGRSEGFGWGRSRSDRDDWQLEDDGRPGGDRERGDERRGGNDR